MIKSLTVRNYLGEEIKITLAEDEPDHGLLLQSIDGLGPTKANINTTDLVTSDGALYNSARIGTRNIVLQFLFTGDIEKTRRLTYKYFPEKKNVRLFFETDYKYLKIDGYVESNEPNIFSKNESTSISIICPDPYFYDLSTKVSTADKNTSLFEFPFECNTTMSITHEPILDSIDDVLTDSTGEIIEDTQIGDVIGPDLIEFGEIPDNPEARISNDGEVNVGVLIELRFYGPCGNVYIYNSGSKQRMEIDVNKITYINGFDIRNGDRLYISSIIGDKYAYLKRDGMYMNVLYCLGEDPDWIYLVNGDNVFTYTSDYNYSNVELTVSANTAHEGI